MPAIDRTDRYFDGRYMAGDPAAWTLERAAFPVRALMLHHSAGFYGSPLDGAASTADEEAQLDALAADHRARFGIGPGYHYVAFPSGRLYAVGKWGTHRAHTKGRNPESGNYWNRDAIGVCAMGDYDVETPPRLLLDALREAAAEVRRIAGGRVPVLGHGLAPTVDGAGGAFAQETACPGRNLLGPLRALNASVGGALDVDRGAIEARLGAIEGEVTAIRRELAAGE